MHSSYDSHMPNITIRHVDPDLHDRLKKRALESGQSLQEYLVRALTDLAHTRSNSEIIQKHWEEMQHSSLPWPAQDVLEDAIALSKQQRDDRWTHWS